MLPLFLSQSELLLNTEITPTYEAHAIFSIVSRNLLPSQWHELLPEAQLQMIEEVNTLMSSNCLSTDQKQRMMRRLQELNHQSTSSDPKWHRALPHLTGQTNNPSFMLTSPSVPSSKT